MSSPSASFFRSYHIWWTIIKIRTTKLNPKKVLANGRDDLIRHLRLKSLSDFILRFHAKTIKDVLRNVVIMRVFFICHLWQKPKITQIFIYARPSNILGIKRRPKPQDVIMGEKLLPFRAMTIPILLTGASTNVSRYGLDTSYVRYIITVRRNVNYFFACTKKHAQIVWACRLWSK